MNIHIALYKWKNNATDQEVEEALSLIASLATKVPGVTRIITVKNTSKFSEGYTHVIMVTTDNQAAMDAYRTHPDHQAAAQQIDAIEEHGIGVDFQTD